MNPRDVVLIVTADGRRIGSELQYFAPGNFQHIQAWVVIYPVEKEQIRRSKSA